jgi:hypothetical protein
MKSVLVRKLTPLVLVLLLISASHALEIVSPVDNEHITAGSELKIVLKPEQNEEISEIVVQLFPLPCRSLSDQFTESITIPAYFLGNYDLLVLVADRLRNLNVLRKTVFVTLPPDVTMKSLSVEPQYVELFKLGPKCPQKDRQMYESEYLRVEGTYSDGIDREISDSVVGTSYRSGDEMVATVTQSGKITARGTGTSVIEVKHGIFHKNVDVTVKPCGASRKK